MSLREAFAFDPADPRVQADLHGAYRRLRDEFPVYRHPGGRLFALSRYEDVEWAFGEPELFASSGVDESKELLPMMIYMEPAQQSPLRALVSRAFTPRRIAGLEAQIRRTTRELFDGWSGEDCGDLMRDVALQLPNRIIAELIGIPAERRGAFLHHTEALISGPGNKGGIARPAAGIYAEFETLLAERSNAPRDDLMSALIAAECGGARLDTQQLLGFCFLLIVGGSDTTTNLIGNGAVLLAQHPEQRDWVAADPARLPGAIEEMLRFESPVQSQPRRPVRDVALRGETIPRNVRLLLLIGAANRDERHWPDPDRFDASRAPTRHLAFGRGAHHCLGSALARLEARIAFEELLTRHPRFALAAPPIWAPSRWARHHPAIPLKLRAN